jgi:hypothetical protein
MPAETSEAFCRTRIDLVLFERLSALESEVATCKLVVHAERGIKTLGAGNTQFTGIADYLFGYNEMDGEALENIMCVCEAKRPSTFSSAPAQCLKYMRMSYLPPIVFIGFVWLLISHFWFRWSATEKSYATAPEDAYNRLWDL